MLALAAGLTVGCSDRDRSGSPDDSAAALGPTDGGPGSPETPADRLADRLRRMPRADEPPGPPASSTRVDATAEQALAMITAGRNDGAEAMLRSALHEFPQSVRLQLLMGVAVHRQSRYGEAEHWYDAVIAAGVATPEIDQLPHFLGWCLYYLGRPSEAQVAFEEHLRRVGDEADSLFALGIIALEDDRIDEAERHLHRSIDAIDARRRDAARDAAKAHLRLGDVYARLDRLDDAEHHLRIGLELHDDHYEGWAKLARLLHRLGRPEEAGEAQRRHDEARRRVGRG